MSDFVQTELPPARYEARWERARHGSVVGRGILWSMSILACLFLEGWKRSRGGIDLGEGFAGRHEGWVGGGEGGRRARASRHLLNASRRHRVQGERTRLKATEGG